MKLFLALIGTSLLFPAHAIQLTLPLSCSAPKACYIPHYVDILPGPDWQDFNGGRLTYDGHKGTDFGIATYEQMRQGVDVLASADGKVLRIRDGEPDLFRSQLKAHLDKIACGNGIVIQHDDYETQYCHLKKNSVLVRPGQSVHQGQVIGQVGSSGQADFPHVHLVVRHHNKVVDPYRQALWHTPLPYHRAGLIDMGVANTVITKETALDAPPYLQRITQQDKKVIVWSRVYGIEAGDKQRYLFYQPNGKLYLKPKVRHFKQPYIEWFSYAGFVIKPNTPKGSWQLHYQLKRKNGRWETVGKQDVSLE